MKRLLFILLFISNYCLAEYYLDLHSGEYSNEDLIKKSSEVQKTEKREEQDGIREERRLREKEEKRVRKEEDRKFFLPEDKLTDEEWEEEISKKPWKNWIFREGEPITADFINTSSNTLIITILDYDAARKDGIFDQKIIKSKYNLFLVLHPGDKYIETMDGHNGVRLARYLQAHKYCDVIRNITGLK